MLVTRDDSLDPVDFRMSFLEPQALHEHFVVDLLLLHFELVKLLLVSVSRLLILDLHVDTLDLVLDFSLPLNKPR